MNLIDLISKHPVPVTRFQRPYVIAEAGVNHEGSMDIARRLIDEAALGGADAIKFQTYKAGTLASKHSPAYWDTSKEPTPSQYELFKKHDSFWKGEFENLKKHCDQAGIAFMSTPFDVESAKFLNDMMDVFKISSSDLTNRPFIEFMCDFKKPIIMSTGAASLAEIAEAVSWIEAKGNPLALLHCVLNYPTMDENAALGMIPALVRHFPQHVIGYSDHTLPNDMKVLEVATLLLVFAALFQFSDVIQVTAAGALRGYQDTRVTMIMTLFAYWGVGLPVGYALGLTDWLGEPSGPSGLWQGLIAGLTCAALMLSVRLVSSAKKRIRAAGK